jgi:hypothetical protein
MDRGRSSIWLNNGRRRGRERGERGAWEEGKKKREGGRNRRRGRNEVRMGGGRRMGGGMEEFEEGEERERRGGVNRR